MGKRKQLYDLEKNVEYGGIEHQRVNPKAKRMFDKPAFAPMPRYTVDTYMASKGHDVKGEMSD